MNMEGVILGEYGGGYFAVGYFAVSCSSTGHFVTKERNR